jgi:hypothetical protein
LLKQSYFNLAKNQDSVTSLLLKGEAIQSKKIRKHLRIPKRCIDKRLRSHQELLDLDISEIDGVVSLIETALPLALSFLYGKDQILHMFSGFVTDKEYQPLPGLSGYAKGHDLFPDGWLFRDMDTDFLMNCCCSLDRVIPVETFPTTTSCVAGAGKFGPEIYRFETFIGLLSVFALSGNAETSECFQNVIRLAVKSVMILKRCLEFGRTNKKLASLVYTIIDACSIQTFLDDGDVELEDYDIKNYAVGTLVGNLPVFNRSYRIPYSLYREESLVVYEEKTTKARSYKLANSYFTLSDVCLTLSSVATHYRGNKLAPRAATDSLIKLVDEFYDMRMTLIEKPQNRLYLNPNIMIFERENIVVISDERSHILSRNVGSSKPILPLDKTYSASDLRKVFESDGVIFTVHKDDSDGRLDIINPSNSYKSLIEF